MLECHISFGVLQQTSLIVLDLGRLISEILILTQQQHHILLSRIYYRLSYLNITRPVDLSIHIEYSLS